MGIIRVKDISCYAFHGCLAEESKIGQRYSVDVEIYVDFCEASKTDDLSKTINYVDINQIVEEEMAIRSKLIEHVGQRILDRFKVDFPQMSGAEVEIKKPNPPIDGHVDYVSVVLSV